MRDKKPRVSEGFWVLQHSENYEGKQVCIFRQVIDDEYVDHYYLTIDGKRQPRSYFGESAHHTIVRKFNDEVHWTQMIHSGMI